MIHSEIFEPAFENHGDFCQFYVYSVNYQECKVVKKNLLYCIIFFLNQCGVLSLKTLFKFQEDNSESKMTIHEPVPNFKGKGGNLRRGRRNEIENNSNVTIK